jgi:hypothetical protein
MPSILTPRLRPSSFGSALGLLLLVVALTSPLLAQAPPSADTSSATPLSVGTGDGTVRCAYATVLENDSPASSPTVTVQNSSLHDFDVMGIHATTGPGALSFVTNIQSNAIGTHSGATAMLILNGASGTISGNTVDNVATGIVVQGGPSTVKSNRISNTNGAVVVGRKHGAV